VNYSQEAHVHAVSGLKLRPGGQDLSDSEVDEQQKTRVREEIEEMLRSGKGKTLKQDGCGGLEASSREEDQIELLRLPEKKEGRGKKGQMRDSEIR